MPSKIPTPPDPRNLLPSRAEPEQREKRKKLEKDHSVGLTEVAVLGLIGLTLAWDIEKQVEKREQKKDEDENEKDRRRRGNGNGSRNRNDSRRRDRDASDRTHGRRTERSGTRDRNRDARRHQSVDHRAGGDRRYRSTQQSRERLPPPQPRYDPRDERRYNDDYDGGAAYYEPRYNPYTDPAGRERRSRRDSW